MLISAAEVEGDHATILQHRRGWLLGTQIVRNKQAERKVSTTD